MTEEEAKKLRCIGPCPVNTGIFGGHQNGGPLQVIYLCSGIDCMAWVEETYYPDIASKPEVIGGYCCYRK